MKNYQELKRDPRLSARINLVAGPFLLHTIRPGVRAHLLADKKINPKDGFLITAVIRPSRFGSEEVRYTFDKNFEWKKLYAFQSMNVTAIDLVRARGDDNLGNDLTYEILINRFVARGFAKTSNLSFDLVGQRIGLSLNFAGESIYCYPDPIPRWLFRSKR